MSLSAPSRQGQLAVEPPSAAVPVAPGALATVESRVTLQLRPTRLRGAVQVASSDSAFAIVQVIERRRAERWITLEVRGAYHAPEPRAVALTYSIDGLSVDQTVTFSPAGSSAPAIAPVPAAVPTPMPETPAPADDRYVPFEDAEPGVNDRDRSAMVAQAVDGATEIEVASALRRISAGIAELLAAAIATVAVVFLGMLITAGPLVGTCGTDPVPGTRCATADSVIINSLVSLLFAGIPLYHAIAGMIGGGIGYRLLGLRIVCRAAWLARPLREELDRVRPGFLRGLLRTFVSYLGALCFALGHLWIFTNPARRGWHDLAAGTIVVRVRRS